MGRINSFFTEEKYRRYVYAIVMIAVALVISFCVYKKNISEHYRIYKDVSLDEGSDGSLCTSRQSLPAGEVRIVLCYAATEDTQVDLVTGVDDRVTYDLPAGDGLYLEAFPTIPQSTDLFQIRVKDGEKCGFELYNYEIESVGLLNTDHVFTAAFIMVIAIACAILYIRYYDKITGKMLITGAVLVGLVVFTSYPLFRDYVVYGHDLWGHMIRIEGIKDALRGGHITASIYPEHNKGYGMLSLLYPQLFVYPAAILRLLDVSMAASWNYELLFINIATAVLTYHSISSICADLEEKGYTQNLYYARIICTVIYMMCPYRLTNMYIRCAIGEMFAMAFLPLFIAGLYHLFVGNPKKWYILAIACTLVLHSHILSVLMYALLGVVMAILMLPAAIKDRLALRLRGLLYCGAVTVIGNIWYLIPFVRLYRSGLSLDSIDQPMFYSYGVFAGQLFMTKCSSGVGRYETEGIVDEMSQTLGMIGTIGALFVLLVLLHSLLPGSKKTLCFLRASFVSFAVFIMMSLTVFPWENLMDNAAVRMITGMIQFPYRFFGAAAGVLAFSVALAVIVRPDVFGFKKEFALLILILGFISCVPILDDALTRDIEVSDMTGGFTSRDYIEYRPHDTDPEIFYDASYHVDGDATVTDYVRNDAGISFNVSAPSDSVIELPLLYFLGYRADCDGMRLNVHKADSNRIMVDVPANTTGTVKVYYSYMELFRP